MKMRRENRRNQKKPQIDRITKTGRSPKSIHHPLPPPSRPPSRHGLAAPPPPPLSTTSPLGSITSIVQPAKTPSARFDSHQSCIPLIPLPRLYLCLPFSHLNLSQ